MNIQILKHFIAIARCNSISDASLKYQITQSNLSRSLQLLEKHVGQQLYNRYHKQHRLTPKGHVVLQEVVKLVAEYEQSIQKLQSDFSKETIRMGFTHGMGNILFPELLKSIERDGKFIDIVPMQGTMDEVREWLHLEKIIMAVNIQDAFDNDLYTTHMYDDQYDLISHKESNIPFGDIIALSDVATLPLIASNSRPIQNLQRLCEQQKVCLNFIHIIENISLLWTLISHNKGHAIQSEVLQIPSFIDKNMLAIRKITPVIKRPIAIGTNKYKSMSENCHYIYRETQNIIKKIL